MDWKNEEAIKRMYAVVCKNKNELFIEVVLLESI